MTQLYPDDCDADVYLKKNIYILTGRLFLFLRTLQMLPHAVKEQLRQK